MRNARRALVALSSAALTVVLTATPALAAVVRHVPHPRFK